MDEIRYTKQVLSLPDDYEGPVIATLIRCVGQQRASCAILYLHGYVDYFFQAHMAESFVREGWNFYALDLRKYGRSLLPHQHAYYCRNLSEYFPEIDQAIEQIVADGNQDITLLGHSTGGLIASLYAASGKRRQAVDRLVLNSPFFAFNTGWFKRTVAMPVVAWLSRLWPYGSMRNELSPLYWDSVHRSAKGEWDFDPQLKPQTGVPLYFAWLGAIRRGHRRLHRGLHLSIPVLVMHSDRSTYARQWGEEFTCSDAVLNVEDIARYAWCLGNRVTDVTIEGGLHDLVLSRREVREKVFKVMVEWITEQELLKIYHQSDYDGIDKTDIPNW